MHAPPRRIAKQITMKKGSPVMIPGLILVLSSCLSLEKQDIPEDPNFIILFTDDQRYDALGFAGNPFISTPNLDSICREGYYFTQACVATSICSPSRAALLTGRFGSANGVVSVGNDMGLKKGERTLFQYLQERDYLTGIVGKWHLGNEPGSCGFGFTSYFKANGTYYGREFMSGGQKEIADRFIEDHLVDQSISFVESALKTDRPFALFHCTQIPHMDHNFDWDVRDSTQAIYTRRDLQPPASWKDDLEGKPAYLENSRSRQRALYYGYRDQDSLMNHLERYYASITELDASLGKLFRFVRKNKLQGSTYIIFMSDNGWFLGDHNFTSKVLAYEESIRVPFAINGPGITPGASDALVMNVDIAPTVMALAGMDIPGNMHGFSLLPLMQGEVGEVRDVIFYEAPESNLGSYPLFAIRTKEWKYIQTYDNQDASRLIFQEIYHLKDDPHEMNNLAGEADMKEMMEMFSGKVNLYRNSIQAD
jgi:arylsulfatase A-like enzyme